MGGAIGGGPGNEWLLCMQQVYALKLSQNTSVGGASQRAEGLGMRLEVRKLKTLNSEKRKKKLATT